MMKTLEIKFHWKRYSFIVITIVLLGVMMFTGFASDIKTYLTVRFFPINLYGGGPLYYGPTSLEERIVGSDVIARVKMDSVSQTVENHIYSGGNVYVGALEFTFKVQEYLKGSGGSEIVGVVYDLDVEYETELGAATFSEDFLEWRYKGWDSREAIVFLIESDSRLPSTEKPGRYWLGHLRYNDLEDYTVTSRYTKHWLPEASEEEVLGALPVLAGGEQRFLTDVSAPRGISSVSASVGPHATSESTTITLMELKTRIVELAGEVADGDGSEAYEKCVLLKYERERETIHTLERLGDYYYKLANHDVGSGVGVGHLLYAAPWAGYMLKEYGETPPTDFGQIWLEGSDSDLFMAEWPGVVSALRPLPAGDYEFYYNERPKKYIICDAWPESERKRDKHLLRVTAPAGTLHEAFFDPEDIGLSSVGAGSGRATLKPADFSVGGAATTIQRIAWDSNRAWMELSSSASLSGHHLDFIELDGSVGLRLDFDDAISTTTDSGSQVLRWGVCGKPWSDGDKLMIRMSQSATDLSGTTNDSSCDGKDIATTTPSVTDMICSNGVVVSNPEDNPQLVRDCETILRALDTLELPDDIPLKWIETKPLADWSGVDVSGSPSRITGLRVQAKGLEGSLPPELARLEALRVLSLSWNRLSGEIPSELGGLSRLEKLYLYNNRLSGEIPSELGDLDNLYLLYLSGNGFSGCVPASLSEIEDNDIPKLELDYCE